MFPFYSNYTEMKYVNQRTQSIVKRNTGFVLTDIQQVKSLVSAVKSRDGLWPAVITMS